MHPALVKIMHLIRHPLGDNNEASSDVLFKADEIEKWTA
jgi:SNF2 family DNA or RNA helicase